MHIIQDFLTGNVNLKICVNEPYTSRTLQWGHNWHDSVSNHQHHDCLLNHLFRRSLKKTSKLCVTGLCAGTSPGTDEFPAQMASNAENVSIWWRHHEQLYYNQNKTKLNKAVSIFHDIYCMWGRIALIVAYFTEEVNRCLAKPPLKFNGGLAKLGLTSWVK